MAVVVITGASSGIGEATARELAGRGHDLVLAARRLDRLQALAAALPAGTRVHLVQTDVSVPAEVERLAHQAEACSGRIDVWINNAGRALPRPWWQADPAVIQRVVDTNLTGAILGARAALPVMLRQGRGHIINVGSVAGSIGVSGVYSATKFGLRGHTESLRREVGRYGVRVSLVSPGYVRTEMTMHQRFPFPIPGADLVARVIARLIDRPRRQVVVPGWYRLFVVLNRLAPALIDRAFAARLSSHGDRSGGHHR